MKQILNIMLIFLLIGCGNNKGTIETFEKGTINGDKLKGLGKYIIGVTTLNDIKEEGRPIYSASDNLDQYNTYSYKHYYDGCMDLDTITGIEVYNLRDNKHNLYDDTLICQLIRGKYFVADNMECNDFTLDFYKDTLVAIGFHNIYANSDITKALDIYEMYLTKYGQGNGYNKILNESFENLVDHKIIKYNERTDEHNWSNELISMKLFHILTHYEHNGNLRSEMTVQIKDKKRFPLFCDRLKETYNNAMTKDKQKEMDIRKKVMNGI